MSHRINLITYKGTPPITIDQLRDNGLTEEDGGSTLQTYLTGGKQVTSENRITAASRLHPLVLGDELVEFLDLLLSYVQNHSHPYHNLPADGDSTIGGTGIKAKKDALLKYQHGGLLELLSKTIYAN